jgi:hypothetical protein
MSIPTTRILRLARIAVLAALLGTLLPSPAVHAADRPVCANSQKVLFKRKVNMHPDQKLYLWVRACVVQGELRLEARQKGLGYGTNGAERPVEGELTVLLHSTTSNGRTPRELKFEKTLWLGDVVEPLIAGVGGKHAHVLYKKSAKLPPVTLPALSPGRYTLSFELQLNDTGDKDPTKTTGTQNLRFKI